MDNLRNFSNTHYKYCNNPKEYGKYRYSFQLEFEHMTRLYSLTEKETYSKLFPRYYAVGEDSSKGPYLCMEYLDGETLEHRLSRFDAYSEPHHFFSKAQIYHLFEQLDLAIHCLYQADMLQFDLSPQNILINNQFDIHLIDFTNCYYLDTRNSCKRIDHRVDPDLPPSIQLRDTCALLFTRLFFSGNEHYATSFSYTKRNCRIFFDTKYPQLLNCLFSSENLIDRREDLAYWDDWYHQLSRLLNYGLY